MDHPGFGPHINSDSATYQIVHMPEHHAIATADSHLTGKRINRGTHIPQSQADVVNKVKMLQIAGQITGTCFRRCVGMDALITLYTVKHDMDRGLRRPTMRNFGGFTNSSNPMNSVKVAKA